MFDFDVWYRGMVIGNIKASSLLKAKNMAHKIYQMGTEPITVTLCS